MNNSQPRIVYNEECIDLRGHFEKDITDDQTNNNLNQDRYRTDWGPKPRTKHERNEVVNTALKKLAKSYNTSTVALEKRVKARIRDTSLYDPYRKKFSDSQDAKSLKSKSDLTALSIKDSKHKLICPSSPTIQCGYEVGDHQRKAEPFKNKFTMTKIKPGNKEQHPREGKNLKRDQSIDKLINTLHTEHGTGQAENSINHVWKDHRLTDKYSLLKLPWKRSHTLPIFSQPSILLKEEYKRKLVDNSDKKTYLYDDGSEVDSLYLEPNRQQNFGYVLQNQLLMLLNVSAYVCAFLVILLIVWFISGNKYFHRLLIPKPPENRLVQSIKYVGGSIVYTLTSIVRLIGSIFAIPTQQVYHPSAEYSWPPANYRN